MLNFEVIYVEGQKIWNTILSKIKEQNSASIFKTWFAGSYVLDFKSEGEKKLLIVGVHNSFVKEQIERRYLEQIKSVIADKKQNCEVIFVVAAKREEKAAASAPIFSGNALSFVSGGRSAQSLNPGHIFENFITGVSNNLAFMAATQCANNPGNLYNPLMIFGPTGVGKTHLLQAVGNEILNKSLNAKVLYVSAERFTNDYVESISNRTQQAFREKYRHVDALLVDDIQFMAGKEGTQDEFFNTFNELYLSGKQIVCVSDRHPREMGKMKERLVSRFLGGMTVDITFPDLEMKEAIIEAKCREKGVKLSSEVTAFIAGSCKGGAREVEGALISVLAMIRLSGGKVSEEEIKMSLESRVQLAKPSVSPGKIIEGVCRHFRVSQGDVFGSSRKAKYVFARQMVMYLLRKELDLPLVQIGQMVGNRDHSTVIHGIEKVEGMKQIRDKNDEILRLESSILAS